jgi:hypothetical protein
VENVPRIADLFLMHHQPTTGGETFHYHVALNKHSLAIKQLREGCVHMHPDYVANNHGLWHLFPSLQIIHP